MMCSNTNLTMAVCFTQAEVDEINDKCGMVQFWAVKQTGPSELMFEPAAEGEGVRMSGYDSSGCVKLMQARKRPKTLIGRVWGMAQVKELAIVRSGIKFTPDMSRTPRTVNRGTDAERIHDRARQLGEAPVRKDVGALMSLREFTQAVDAVNTFVTQNEGHVVLEVRNGLLKFLVEG